MWSNTNGMGSWTLWSTNPLLLGSRGSYAVLSKLAS